MKGNGFLTTLWRVMGPVEHADAHASQASFEARAGTALQDEDPRQESIALSHTNGVLQISSFYGHSIDEAMRKAESSLGPEAVILSTKTTDLAFRHEGAYEVVCGLMPACSPGTPSPGPEQRADEPVRLTDEVVALRRQIEELRRRLPEAAAVSSQALTAIPVVRDPRRAEALFAALHDAGLSDARAREIVETTLTRVARRHPTGPAVLSPKDLQQTLLELVPVATMRVSGEAEPKCMVLIGPPGGGKSTSLMKMAEQLLREGVSPLRILALDPLRSGEAGPLARFAEARGVAFESVHTPEDLRRSLELHAASATVLVDTPGYGVADVSAAMALSRALEGCERVEVHLVLPAILERTALARAVDFFEVFHPARLLFTMLDQSERIGGAFEQVLRTRKPVSFLASGRNGSGTIQPASPGTLIRLLLRCAEADAVRTPGEPALAAR
jgi:flagellar biosynthesis GTPase FlhF